MKGRALGPPRAVHWVLTPTSYQPSSAKGSCRLSLRTGSLEVEPEARLVGVQVVGWKCPQETPERGRGKQEERPELHRSFNTPASGIGSGCPGPCVRV